MALNVAIKHCKGLRQNNMGRCLETKFPVSISVYAPPPFNQAVGDWGLSFNIIR